MAVYYIDPVNGKNTNSGRSESEPLQTNRGLQVLPGDTVLFKRGSLIRDALWNVDGSVEAPVTYGAYGEGENPIFSGSVDVSDEKDWTEISENVWKCTKELSSEACNFVFPEGNCGTLRWEKEELKEQGDWWDSCMGYGEVKRPYVDHQVLLYSEKNPALYYGKIECVQRVHRSLARMGRYMVIQDLTFCNNGVHAIAGAADPMHVKIRNCRFEYIGGSVWSKELKIRFGNGVECWDTAEDITVEKCVFYEIYDSGFTHQGGDDTCVPAVHVSCCDNVFIKCGMAAYEQRDRLPRSLKFCRNLCADAGKGFSKLGEVMPRRSEIWPQPMGHHIFLWRIQEPTPNAEFEISGNVFLDAPYGTAIYSIIDEEAEKQILIDHNFYYMQEKCLFNRYLGQAYKNFMDYKEFTGKDKNGCGF